MAQKKKRLTADVICRILSAMAIHLLCARIKLFGISSDSTFRIRSVTCRDSKAYPSQASLRPAFITRLLPVNRPGRDARFEDSIARMQVRDRPQHSGYKDWMFEDLFSFFTAF